MPFEPVKKVRTYEDVLAQIQRALERSEYKPGDQLPSERELALAMGVNRSAVRQALHTLSLLRILDIRAGEGVFVRDFRTEGSLEALLLEHVFGGDSLDPSLVRDLMQIRRFVEIPMAGLAAQHRTADQLAELDQLLALQAAAIGDPKAFFELDRRFHMLLAVMAGNRMIPRILNTLGLLVKRMFGPFADLLDRTERSFAQHQAIAKAVLDRDVRGAEAAMAAHLGDVIDQLEEAQ